MIDLISILKELEDEQVYFNHQVTIDFRVQEVWGRGIEWFVTFVGVQDPGMRWWTKEKGDSINSS